MRDYLNTPIFIQNFNQLTYLKKQVSWFLQAGYRNIVIIDNASSYPPLLRYYEELGPSGSVRIIRRTETNGKLALWKEGILQQLNIAEEFVFTSSDIVPDRCCPGDVVAYLASQLRNHGQIFKIGLGLRVDDLPESYAFRPEVLVWESRFWRAPVARGLFMAPIDATFALYRAGSEFALTPALRTGWPYVARHEPWYADSAHPSPEELYYRATLPPERGTWGRDVLPNRMASKVKHFGSRRPTLVHLACGRDVLPGWINVDSNLDLGADAFFDQRNCREQRLSIADGSVDGFFMMHGFAEIDSISALMQELHRAAKPGGRFIARMPAAFFKERWCRYARKQAFAAADWQATRIRFVVESDTAETIGDDALFDRGELANRIVSDVIVDLCAIKPSRPKEARIGDRPVRVFAETAIDPESTF